MYSQNIAEQLDGIVYFRKILAVDRNPPIDLVVESGVVPRLVEFLTRQDHPNLQLEAAWAITNIACGSKEQVEVLIHQQTHLYLIQLLSIPHHEALREQALWALGNISIDPSHARTLLQHDLISPILDIVGTGKPKLAAHEFPSLSSMRHVTWTCLNLLRAGPIDDVASVLLLILTELFESPDEDIILEICKVTSC